MKKGFTLIEMIAVIAILALLLLIIVPSVNGILNRSKEKLNDEQIAQIENAARNWGLKNIELEDIDGDNQLEPTPSFVSIKTLKHTGFLEDKVVKELETNSELKDDTKICITYEKNQYIYTLEGDC